jgi:hypothetical protein
MNEQRKSQTFTVGQLANLLSKQDQTKPVFFCDAVFVGINSIYVDETDGVVVLGECSQQKQDEAHAYLRSIGSINFPASTQPPD